MSALMNTQQPTDVTDDMVWDPLATVSSYTNMGRTAIYAAIKDDGFPEPYQLGKRIARWRRTEILAWLESRPRGTRLTSADKARQRRTQA